MFHGMKARQQFRAVDWAGYGGIGRVNKGDPSPPIEPAHQCNLALTKRTGGIKPNDEARGHLTACFPESGRNQT